MLKRFRNYYHRRYRKTHFEKDWQTYWEPRKAVNKNLRESRNYYLERTCKRHVKANQKSMGRNKQGSGTQSQEQGNPVRDPVPILHPLRLQTSLTPTLLTQPSNLCITVNHMHCIGARWCSFSKILERMKSWRLWRDWMCTDQLEWMESHPTYYVWSHQSPRVQQQSSHLTLDPYLYYLSLWMSLSHKFISNSTPTWQRNLCSTHVNQVLALNTAP